MITTAAAFLLERFVLEPLIAATIEKFDWKKAVSKYRNPHQPFRLIINITDQNLEIITKPDLWNQKHIEEIWETIGKTIALLRGNNLLDKINKIYLVSEKPDELLVICHKESKPSYIADLNANKIVPLKSNPNG